MAATTEASTPRNDSFHPVDRAPRSPTTLPSISASTYLSSKSSPQLNKALPLGRASPAPKTPQKGLSPHLSPQPLTGAAALADARRAEQERARSQQARTSPNPHQVALRALMGSTGMSKASDAPTTSQMSEPMQRVAEKVNVADRSTTGSSQQQSNGSRPNTTDSGAITATAASANDHAQFVEEPESMENSEANAADGQENANRPSTYHGSQSVLQHEAVRRDMSLPGTGYERSPKSTSAKRHKCPYCSTDFTRHHNLKSHLLTHSQEKPYVCKTCQSRFRRLHDLKRHEKLHTGERPHTCPRCGRKFARGDALARHNKGPGGCAGRRSSFGNDDDGEGDGEGDDTMDGLEYQDEQGSDDRQGDSGMFDASGRRVSEPYSRKRAYPDSGNSYDSSRPVYRQHSSTYPPPPGRVLREQMGNMGPPHGMMTQPDQPSVESTYSSQLYPHPPGPGYPQMTITESPKPLSPAGQAQQRLSISEQSGLRGRSPSLNSYQFGRPSGHAQSIPTHASLAPQLPSLSGLAPGAQQNNRLSFQQAHSSNGGAPMVSHQPQQMAGGQASGATSQSSHKHSSSGSMRDFIGTDPHEMWNYMRSLEQRFSRMQDEYELRISRLQEDVISLKSQVYQGR